MHSSYFISGFGAGNKMIDPYVILAMPFNFSLRNRHLYHRNNLFIMAMPLNMILVVCHTMYIVI